MLKRKANPKAGHWGQMEKEKALRRIASGKERRHGDSKQHKVALSHGFKPRDMEGQAVYYEHPDGSRLDLYRDGIWLHKSPTGIEASGSGHSSLQDQLERFSGKDGNRGRSP